MCSIPRQKKKVSSFWKQIINLFELKKFFSTLVENINTICCLPNCRYTPWISGFSVRYFLDSLKGESVSSIWGSLKENSVSNWMTLFYISTLVLSFMENVGLDQLRKSISVEMARQRTASLQNAMKLVLTWLVLITQSLFING